MPKQPSREELIRYYKENFNTLPPERFLKQLESLKPQEHTPKDGDDRIFEIALMAELEEVQGQLDDAKGMLVIAVDIMSKQDGAIESVIQKLLYRG